MNGGESFGMGLKKVLTRWVGEGQGLRGKGWEWGNGMR